MSTPAYWTPEDAAASLERIKQGRKQRHGWKRRGILLTQAEYDSMLSRQRGRCAGCHRPCASGKRLGVDHDHVTKKVRGLLCLSCNLALGYAKDDPTTLKRLARYLERQDPAIPARRAKLAL